MHPAENWKHLEAALGWLCYRLKGLAASHGLIPQRGVWQSCAARSVMETLPVPRLPLSSPDWQLGREVQKLERTILWALSTNLNKAPYVK